MTTMRKFVRAQVSALGDDEVEVVMSTSALARDGHILVPRGCRIADYQANPIVLWSHDPDTPVGNAEDVVVSADRITARVRFAPLGASEKADEIRRLTKAGVIRAVSISFNPLEGEPLDPKKPRGGQRFTDWELLELSFVSVPADTGAVVTARANGDNEMADWKVGASRDLPIEDSDDWDGAAAEASIFAWAGGDDFEPAKARKGFLVYDAEKPKERGSYKLPIAHAVDGELKVPKGAIRAAASRLPDTDVPEDVKTRAGGVLDAYKEKAGIGEDGDRAARPKTRQARVRRRAVTIAFKRGLWDVANLACLLQELCWIVDCAEFEAALEGDESQVPGKLKGVLDELGEALIAMTEEEVGELLAAHADEPEDDDELAPEERTAIAAAASPLARTFRRALAHAKLREGKTLSAANAKALRDANDKDDEAIAMHRSAIRTHKEAQAIRSDLLERAGYADDDEQAKEVQTSDGTGESEGTENDRASADFKRRQADLEALAAH